MADRQNTAPDFDRYIWLFFRFSGRVDRPAYVLAGLLLYVARLYPVFRILREPEGSVEAAVWGGILLLVLGATLLPHFALAVKRLHDIDRPGVWALAFLLGDIVFFIVLSLIPGTPGPNRYGGRVNGQRDP